MLRLLLVLGAAMFLTMQIGGRDYGQQRFGLKLAAEQAASATPTAATPAPIAVVEAPEAVVPESPAPEPVVVTEAPAPEPVTEVAAASPVESPVTELPVVYVTANAINVREGPSTNFGIVGRLTKGEAVSVVSSDAEGWLRIRLEGDGLEGFVAARLMTELEPN